MHTAIPLLAITALLTAAACSANAQPSTSPQRSATGRPTPSRTKLSTTMPQSPSSQPTTEPTSAGSTPQSGCLTNDLSLRLEPGGVAAGSYYQPIVFTNTGSNSCTLFGYPGVAFVAPGTGKQVGAAASRNPQHAPVTVTLAPGAGASSMVQIVAYPNYPPKDCQHRAVSGLRVYPPGNTRAAYVRFRRLSTACSTQVRQLAVEAVVHGTTGQ